METRLAVTPRPVKVFLFHLMPSASADASTKIKIYAILGMTEMPKIESTTRNIAHNAKIDFVEVPGLLT